MNDSVRITRGRLACAVLSAILAAAPALADRGQPAPLRDLTGSGSWYEEFAFSPNFSVGYEYDDNIYATDTGEISDRVMLATLGGKLSSEWKRHSLQAGAGASIARYNDYDSEDTEDYWATLSGRADLTPDSNVFGGLSYARDHEARGSIEAVSGDEPTIYHKRQANAGFKQSVGAFGLTLAGNLVRYDYENTPAGAGEIFNDDRDRDASSLGLRITYARSEHWSHFAQLRSDRRRYELAVDDFSYQRDSSGYRAGIGAQADFGERLQADVMLGWLSQDYDDPRFDTVDAFDYEAGLSWYLSDASHLRLALAHSLEETTLPGSPGYLYRQVSARWSERFSDVLFGQVTASYGEADYQQSIIVDDYYTVGAGLSRTLTKGVLGGIEWRHLQRDSTQTGDDFVRNQISVSISGRF